MKYEIVNQAATISAGVLVLSDVQAKPRLHNLEDLGKGRYEVVKPVQFKIGEVIGYEGDLPKNSAIGFITEKEKSAQAAAAAKAAKAAADKTAPPAGPTVDDIKAKLDALNIKYDSKAKKAELEELLAYAEKVTAKAVELSGLEQSAFDALSAAERESYFDAAEKVLAK